MSDFQRDIVLPGSFLHPRHPIIGKRALVGVIEDKTGLLYMRMFCTFLKPRRLRFWSKGQVLERDAAVRVVRDRKSLVSQILGIGKEFPFSPLCGEDAKPLSSLRLGIPDALVQQIIGIAVPFHRAGDPQAVDVEIPLGFNRHPCVFRRNVLNKALAPLLASVKDKALVKSLLEPFLFGHALLPGHGAADMLLVDIVFRDPDIVHIVPILP